MGHSHDRFEIIKLFKPGSALSLTRSHKSHTSAPILLNYTSMSTGVVLTQFSNLVNHMELIGPKLKSSIRPTRDQFEQFRTLAARLKAALAGVESDVEILLRKAAPKENELKLAQAIRSPKTMNSQLATLLRKNLVLIFCGPEESALDSPQVRARKLKTRSRCGKLRSQNPQLILMWAMSLQPSTWIHQTIMPNSTFDYLIKELKAERSTEILTETAEILQVLNKEGPLCNCRLFQLFLADFNQSTERQERDTAIQLQLSANNTSRPTTERQEGDSGIPYKRRRITEISTFYGESHGIEDDGQRQLELIQRSKRKNNNAT